MINKVIGAKNGKNGCINVKTVTWASFYFAVHAVWWEKIKNGGARETWEELRYPISFETRKNCFASSTEKFFILLKRPFTG